MLGQRADPDQLVVGASAVPVGAELVLALCGPFTNEPQRARWEPAVDQLEPVDRDLGDVLRTKLRTKLRTELQNAIL